MCIIAYLVLRAVDASQEDDVGQDEGDTKVYQQHGSVALHVPIREMNDHH